jgi:hypothetical protein
MVGTHVLCRLPLAVNSLSLPGTAVLALLGGKELVDVLVLLPRHAPLPEPVAHLLQLRRLVIGLLLRDGLAGLRESALPLLLESLVCLGLLHLQQVLIVLPLHLLDLRPPPLLAHRVLVCCCCVSMRSSHECDV